MRGFSGNRVAAITVALLVCWAARGQDQGPGGVWAWGDNIAGQLGNGSTGWGTGTPSHVEGLSGIVAVAAGAWHSLALRSDGTVWAWGFNQNGQLGTGSNEPSSIPVQVPGLGGVTSIACGWYHSMAVKGDGTLWVWGYNGYGQLGNGSTSDSAVPLQVTGLSGCRLATGGCFHTLALLDDGSVLAWGDNDDGQLGDGTGGPGKFRTLPAPVSGLGQAAGLAGGWYHSLAVKTDGTVWAWGYNRDGELGNGASGGASYVPVQVAGLSGAIRVSAGAWHSMALTGDGAVWTWGGNDAGQLGNGSLAASSVPTSCSGGLSATAISAGGENLFSLAVSPAGTAWGWGDDGAGQIGRPPGQGSTVPAQVSDLTGVMGLAAGGNHALALVRDDSCLLTSEPQVPAAGLTHAPIAFTPGVSRAGCAGPLTYEWDFGDGSSHSSLEAPIHSFASPAIYFWSLTVEAGGAVTHRAGSINIKVPPPVVDRMTRLTSPFRIKVVGSNLQENIRVLINGQLWGSLIWKSPEKVVLVRGASLKRAAPKGQVNTFTFINPDGGMSDFSYRW